VKKFTPGAKQAVSPFGKPREIGQATPDAQHHQAGRKTQKNPQSTWPSGLSEFRAWWEEVYRTTTEYTD